MSAFKENKEIKKCCHQGPCFIIGPTGPTGPSGGPIGPTGSTGPTEPYNGVKIKKEYRILVESLFLVYNN